MHLIISIIIGVLLIMMTGLMHAPPLRRYVLEYGKKYLNTSQQMDLQAAKLEYNLFGLSGTLHEVTIRASHSPQSPPFLTASRASVNLRAVSLIRGRFAVEEAKLEGVRIHIVIDENGNLNLPRQKENPRGPPATIPDFLIDSLTATGSEVIIEDRRRGTVRLPEWRLSIDGKPTTLEHSIRFIIRRAGEAMLETRRLSVNELGIRLQWRGDQLHVREAKLRLGDTRLAVDGRIDNLLKPVLTLNAEAGLQVGELMRFIYGREDFAGQIKLQAKLSGPFSAPSVSARVRGDALAFGIHDKIGLEADLSWDPGTGFLNADPLAIRSPYGGLSGRASLATEIGESSIEATFDNVDLMQISSQLGLEMQIASTASGNIYARWPGMEWNAADGRARIRLATRKEPSERIIPLRGHLNLETQSGLFRIAVASLEALGTIAKGTLSLDLEKNLGGAIQVETTDISGVVAKFNRVLGRESTEQPVTGGVRLSVRLAGTLDDPRLTAEVDSGPLSNRKIRDLFFSTTASYGHKSIRISESRIAWQDQSVRASGEIGLAGESPEFRLELLGKEIKLSQVLSPFFSEPPLEGIANFYATVSGTTEHPSAMIRFTGEELRAYGEPWGRINATASFRDGRIEVEDLRLEKPGMSDRMGVLLASGSYKLESREYDFEAKTDLELGNLVLPAGRVIRGRFLAEAKGAGVALNPEADIAVSVNGLELDERRLGDFNFNGRIADHVGDGRLRAPGLGMESRIRASLQSPYTSDFDIKVDIQDLAILALHGPDGETISGSIQGILQGSGELANWKSLNAGVRFEKANAVVNRQKIRAVTPVVVRLEKGILHVQPVQIMAGEAHLNLSGSLPLEAAYSSGEEFRVDAEGRLEDLMAFLPDLGEILVKGILQAKAVVRGGLDRPEPTLTATLKEGEIFPPQLIEPITNIELEVATRDREIILDRLSAQWAGAKISATAMLPLGILNKKLVSEPPSAAHFSASLLGLSPESIPGVPEGITGSVALQLEGKASRLELGALSAHARFDELQLRIGNFSLEQSIPAGVSLLDGLVTLDSFELTGSGTRLEATGTARLDGTRDLSIRVAGSSDASLFTSLSEDLRAAGPTEFVFAATGPISEPQITGYLQLRNGRIAAETVPVRGEKLDISLRLTPGLVEIIEGTGTLNGGRFNITGSGSYGQKTVRDISFLLDVDNMDMNFPEGLRTLSDARIRIKNREDQILVEGNVTVEEGSFRDDLELSKIFGFGGGIQFIEDRNPMLSRVRFNVKIETAHPILVNNRQAKLLADSELVLVGTYYRPSVTGRLLIEEGGEVYLAEHRYSVDTGIIDFVNESKIEPSINLLARTRAAGYDINLRIQGSPGKIDASFTSDPSLPEPDIISLLLTGRTLEEARGSGLNIAQQHAMSYLTGQLGSRLSRSAQDTLGLSRVRIEPNLVSGDSNPGARLTVGQDLRRDLQLVYSMNLVDSSDQILIGEYDLTRSFTFRGTNQSDNSRRLDFQHDLRFGGKRARTGKRSADAKIGHIEFMGKSVFPEKVLLDRLRVRPGQSYDFFRLRQGIDRLEKYYRDNDYLETRIRFQQERRSQTVDLLIEIDAGSSVAFVFKGHSLPRGLRNQVRRIWESGVFDARRTSDAVDAIKRWFIREQYLEAEISCTINPSPDGAKEVLCEMASGIPYKKVALAFDGAGGIRADRLEQLIRKEPEAFVNSIINPQRTANLLMQYYRQQGYLAARIDPPQTQLDRETAACRILFPIKEGPLFRIGRIDFVGNHAVPEAELRAVVTVARQAPYKPETLRNSVEKLEELYWSRGYNDVTIEYLMERSVDRQEVDIRFQIDEQQQGRIARIEVAGNNEIGEGFIRRHLKLGEGDVLDHTKTELSRRALYKTGSFDLVELDAEPITTATGAVEESHTPLLLRARVREVVPYKIRYGGFYDTDRGLGAIFDFENRNSLLGGARVLGARGRFDSDLREVRTYFGQPLHFKFPSTASATAFVQRELRDAFISDRIGFTLQQELELRENMVLSYGYRFERTHTYRQEMNPLLPFDKTQRIAPLTTSFTWDTRDRLLDASRGFFFSNGLEYAPSLLGSDVHYIKYFGQIFKYFPLTEPTEIPFGRGIKKSRVIYAGGLRVGLAGGFGGQAISESERFFAGGGTTVRGFTQDSIGPKDLLGNPVGGDAVFIMNNEVRFPIMSIFEGVGFVDIGNVYPRAADFNPIKVRGSAGPGLRVRTPYFLLRFDYGFKLDRQPGESLGAFYFSIGQTF